MSARGQGRNSPYRTVAWGVGLIVGCRVVQLALEAQSLAALVGQVVLVEWAAARIGLGASEDGAETPTGALVRRALVGLGVGSALAAVIFGTLWASRNVVLEPVSRPAVSLVAIGLASAALTAWRDEMLVHGVAVRALEEAAASRITKILACGATSVGAAIGRGEATAASLVVAAELGILFGALWVWDRDRPAPARFAAPAAHLAFRFATETLFAGGLFHTRVAANSWAGGDAGMLGGTAAVAALLPLCLLAIRLTVVPRISPRSAGLG